jgi:hypothetical protein
MSSNRIAITALAFASVASLAASSDAADVTRTRFKDESASVSFFATEEITCEDGTTGFIDTSITINAFEQVVSSTFGNSEGSSVFASFFEFDSCTSEFVSAFAFDDSAEYDQSRVESASITATFDLVDDFTLEPIGTLSADIDLTGTGDTTRTNSRSTTQSGDFTFKFRSQGTFREATISGTISLDGEDLTGLSQSAQLSNTRSGDMTVSR